MRAKAEPPNPDPPGTSMSPFVCVLYRYWLTYYCNLRLLKILRILQELTIKNLSRKIWKFIKIWIFGKPFSEDEIPRHTAYFDQLVINFCDAALSNEMDGWWEPLNLKLDSSNQQCENTKVLKEHYAGIFRHFCALLLKAEWNVLGQRSSFWREHFYFKRGGDDALFQGYWIIKRQLTKSEFEELITRHTGKTYEKTEADLTNGDIDYLEIAHAPWVEHNVVLETILTLDMLSWGTLFIYVLNRYLKIITLQMHWPDDLKMFFVIGFFFAIRIVYQIVVKCCINKYEKQREISRKHMTEDTPWLKY